MPPTTAATPTAGPMPAPRVERADAQAWRPPIRLMPLLGRQPAAVEMVVLSFARRACSMASVDFERAGRLGAWANVPLLVHQGMAERWIGTLSVDTTSGGQTALRCDEGRSMTRLSPRQLLDVQRAAHALWGTTLDVCTPIASEDPETCARLADMSATNAQWAMLQPRGSSYMRLLASVHGTHEQARFACVQRLAGMGFRDFALRCLPERLGGVEATVATVRSARARSGPDGVIHVHDAADAAAAAALIRAGATSADTWAHARAGHTPLADPTPVEAGHQTIARLRELAGSLDSTLSPADEEVGAQEADPGGEAAF